MRYASATDTPLVGQPMRASVLPEEAVAVQVPNTDRAVVCHALLWDAPGNKNGDEPYLVPHFLQPEDQGRTVGKGGFGRVRARLSAGSGSRSIALRFV
jgi:hypothetical protein